MSCQLIRVFMLNHTESAKSQSQPQNMKPNVMIFFPRLSQTQKMYRRYSNYLNITSIYSQFDSNNTFQQNMTDKAGTVELITGDGIISPFCDVQTMLPHGLKNTM